MNRRISSLTLTSNQLTLLFITLLICLSFVLVQSFKVHAQTDSTTSADPTPTTQVPDNFVNSTALINLPAVQSGPVDLFLKIDGVSGFEGESVDKQHPNEIIVHTYSFGDAQSGSGATGGG